MQLLALLLKKVKFEVLANNTNKITDTEMRLKNISVEEMLEMQRIEYQKYIQGPMDQQQAKH